MLGTKLTMPLMSCTALIFPGNNLTIHNSNIRLAVLLIYCYYIFFFFLTAWEMKVDYTFPRRIFSSKKSTQAKILNGKQPSQLWFYENLFKCSFMRIARS